MAFTQLIRIEGADEQALHDHAAAWDSEQRGVAPGYIGVRVLASQDTPGRHVIEVDFSSEEEARENDERDETRAWATKLRELGTVPDAGYQNLRLVCSTYPER
jgi:hypothetical protein